MNKLYLCTHYGFGDYVMCYGLIRELALNNDIMLYAIPHRSALHLENIKRLYSNIDNVTVTTEDPALREDVIYLGYNNFFETVAQHPTIKIHEYIYAQFNIELSKMWDNFHFERDHDREKEIYYNRMGLKDGEDYIFLHDDPARGYVINRSLIRDTKIVSMDNQEVSILDILYVVEHASEVHTYNTGLLLFIDQMIQHDSLNYHQYVRPATFEHPILKLKWNIL